MLDFKKKSLQTIEWIINSGIRYQYPENNIDAFYESYNTHNKRYSFLYCEVTGYAIKLLLNFQQREKNNKYLFHFQNASADSHGYLQSHRFIKRWLGRDVAILA